MGYTKMKTTILVLIKLTRMRPPWKMVHTIKVSGTNRQIKDMEEVIRCGLMAVSMTATGRMTRPMDVEG